MSEPCRPVITVNDCTPSPVFGAPTPTPTPAPRSGPMGVDAYVSNMGGVVGHPESHPPVGQSGPQAPHVLPDGWDGGVGAWHLPSVHTLGVVAEASAAVGTAGVLAGGALLAAAQWRQWHPRQVGNYAAGSLTLPVTSALVSWDWRAPLTLLEQGSIVAAHGLPVSGVVGMAVLTVPAAWSWAAWWWARHMVKLRDIGHRNPNKTQAARQRMRFASTARAKSAVRYPVPFSVVTRLGPRVVIGAAAGELDSRKRGPLGLLVQRRRNKWLSIPVSAINSHCVLTGDSGSGKTTMLQRFSAGLMDVDWKAYLRTRTGRPLLVMIDCGGDLPTGRRFVQLMTRMGVDPRRIGLWPVTTRFDLWSMSAVDMTATLQAMLSTGSKQDDTQAHFASNRRRAISLAVGTALSDAGVRVAKPMSRRELFARLTPSALKKLYAADPAMCQEIDALGESKPPAVEDTAGKLRDVFESLGDSFEGGRPLDSFDALYICAPGTTLKETARAQVSAVKEMLMQLAIQPGHGRRIRLIIDEASALADESGDIGMSMIAERARKYGLSMVAAAQSEAGLGAGPSEAGRLVDTCSGGWIAMRGIGTAGMCEKYGTTTVTEATHNLDGRKFDKAGSLSTGDAMLVHPNMLREMDPGQAIYTQGLKALRGQVAPIDLDDIPRLERPAWTLIDTPGPRVPTADLHKPQPAPAPRRARPAAAPQDGGPTLPPVAPRKARPPKKTPPPQPVASTPVDLPEPPLPPEPPEPRIDTDKDSEDEK